jgi:hypothetical protein
MKSKEIELLEKTKEVILNSKGAYEVIKSLLKEPQIQSLLPGMKHCEEKSNNLLNDINDFLENNNSGKEYVDIPIERTDYL